MAPECLRRPQLSEVGSLFHTRGAVTQNALSPNFRFVRGTMKCVCHGVYVMYEQWLKLKCIYQVIYALATIKSKFSNLTSRTSLCSFTFRSWVRVNSFCDDDNVSSTSLIFVLSSAICAWADDNSVVRRDNESAVSMPSNSRLFSAVAGFSMEPLDSDCTITTSAIYVSKSLAIKCQQ